jgi:hypothetical protein
LALGGCGTDREGLRARQGRSKGDGWVSIAVAFKNRANLLFIDKSLH